MSRCAPQALEPLKSHPVCFKTLLQLLRSSHAAVSRATLLLARGGADALPSTAVEGVDTLTSRRVLTVRPVFGE